MNADTLPAVASPCVGVCRLEPAQPYCLGCKRTIEEIAAWPKLTQAQKLEILRLLPARGHTSAAPAVMVGEGHG